MKNRNRLILLALMVTFALPVIVPFFMLNGDYSTKNNGNLIKPVFKVSEVSLTAWPENTAIEISYFDGLWELVVVSENGCDSTCLENLYKSNQVRLTQIKNFDDLRVTWLTNDSVPDQIRTQVATDYPDIDILNYQAEDNKWIESLKQHLALTELNGIYINDHLGYMMMNYPQGFDPSLIKKDVKHLFKAISTQKKRPTASNVLEK